MYWRPVEASVRANQTVRRNLELRAVRDYLENTELCRRFMLLKYFDPVVGGLGTGGCAVTTVDLVLREVPAHSK